MSKFYTTKVGVYPEGEPETGENEYTCGTGWSVLQEGETYFLSYISGSIEGREVKVEISKEDFFIAKNKGITLDEMCRKYNTH